YRSALVGLGVRGDQQPLIVIEPEPGLFPRDRSSQSVLEAELLELAAGHILTQPIRHLLFHPSLPVDTRHNVKINRELLAQWAAMQTEAG
ncbi:MAG: peptide synthase, partial [Planctomycetaceae bacterium]|nr:peptide synthase [Planctomycetaceae bacterium]